MRNKRQPEVWCGAVFALVLLLCAVPSLAQNDTIDRIENARDQAALRQADLDASASDAGDNASALIEDATEVIEPEREIREEERRPLGPSTRSGFGNAESGTPSRNDGWVLQTLGSLGVVIALILIARFLIRKGALGGRFSGVSVRSNSNAVVEVLSRTSIAPRNHVLLLRVGHRILVVNDAGGAMRTLATVDDPDEVAGLLQSVQSAKDSSMSSSFAGVMSKVAGQWGGVDELEAKESDELQNSAKSIPTGLQNPLASLRGKLRAMSGAGQGGGA